MAEERSISVAALGETHKLDDLCCEACSAPDDLNLVASGDVLCAACIHLIRACPAGPITLDSVRTGSSLVRLKHALSFTLSFMFDEHGSSWIQATPVAESEDAWRGLWIHERESWTNVLGLSGRDNADVVNNIQKCIIQNFAELVENIAWPETHPDDRTNDEKDLAAWRQYAEDPVAVFSFRVDGVEA